AETEAERAPPTMLNRIERFRTEHLPRKRPSPRDDYERTLRLHIGPHFGQHTKVADAHFEDVDRLHRKLTAAGSPYQANRTIALLSKMFSLAIRWRMSESNPCMGIEKNTEYHRRRYLNGDELVRLTKSLAKHPDRQAADAIRLLLLTGARRGEVLGMRWDDVKLGTGIWSKLPSSTKQKEHHQVPLSAPVLQLLSEIDKRQRRAGKRPKFVFPGNGGAGHLLGIKKSWAPPCKAADLQGPRIH